MKELKIQVIYSEHSRIDVTPIDSPPGDKYLYQHTNVRIVVHFPKEVEIRNVELTFDIKFDMSGNYQQHEKALREHIKKIFNYLGPVIFADEALITYLR